MLNSESIVVANNVSRMFQSGDTAVTALNDISLEITQGQHVALVGRSGSGKTTLLNLLSGLDRPTSGQLVVAGQDLATTDRNELAEFRLRKIGVIFQSFQLIESRTAQANVELPMILAGVNKTERQAIAVNALERVGLANRASHLPGKLSGGEKQRVAIARSIVNRPRLLLADEPTGNLDSWTSEIVMQLLLEVVAENDATLFLITHDSELAVKCSNKIVKLTDGVFSEFAEETQV